jgi:hypothetical protein
MDYKIPIKKNIENKLNNDFLIISYNEEARSYKEDDCKSIINNIINEVPSFVIICTQESRSGITNHFQHILNIELGKINYYRISKTDESKTIVKIFNKNIRVRFYINQIKVSTKFYKPLKNSYFSEDKYSKKVNNNNKDNKKYDYYLKSCIVKRSKKSFGYEKFNLLGRIFKGTLFKGAICLEIIIENNDGKIIKFLILNTHLYYKNSIDTGLEYRKEIFLKLIKEFELVEKMNDNYNIFYCGDLNFRLHSYIKKLNNHTIQRNIIKEYILNNSLYKHESSKKFINGYQLKDNLIKNELVNYFNYFNNKDDDIKKLIKLFKISIEKIGIHLSCKYTKDKFNVHKKMFIEKETNNKKIDKQNTFVINKSGVIRIPSSCDKILFALNGENTNNYKNNLIEDYIVQGSDIKISPYNFDIYLFPDKSDHKLISLSMSFIN